MTVIPPHIAALLIFAAVATVWFITAILWKRIFPRNSLDYMLSRAITVINVCENCNEILPRPQMQGEICPECGVTFSGKSKLKQDNKLLNILNPSGILHEIDIRPEHLLRDPYIREQVSDYILRNEDDLIDQIAYGMGVQNNANFRSAMKRNKLHLEKEAVEQILEDVAQLRSNEFYRRRLPIGVAIGVLLLLIGFLAFAKSAAPDSLAEGLGIVVQIFVRLAAVTIVLFAILFYILAKLFSEVRRHSIPNREEETVLRQICFGIASVVGVLIVAWIFNQQITEYIIFMSIFQDILADITLVLLYDMGVVKVLQKRAPKTHMQPAIAP